jgi:flagellar assembly protein FliH
LSRSRSASPAARVDVTYRPTGAPAAFPPFAPHLLHFDSEAALEAYVLADGYGAGQSRVAAQTERLSQILSDLARPLENLNEEVVEQIVALSTALARQLLRRELRQDRSQIISIVREAVGQLPVSARDVRIQLHPEDAAVVRESLAPAEHERAWTLVEDPMMMRGGCQVLTATSRVDARLDSRLGALLTEIMGSERDHGPRADGT